MSADVETVNTALMAGRAEDADGPAYGGTEWAGRAEFPHGLPHEKGSLRDRLRRRPPAALDREPPRPSAPDGAVAGQAPPPDGRADRPTPNLPEANVTAIHLQDQNVELVDPADLICPGCFEPAVGERPPGWPATAGTCPEFSHRDGSVLCPDAGGAIGEPVEASQLRFRLTEQGTRVLGSYGISP